MKVKQVVKVDVRQTLIERGLITPGGKVSRLDCDKCGNGFDRLADRTWEKTCGSCQYKRRDHA